MDRSEAIFEWNMTQQEAAAFHLCVIWEEQTKKLFPGVRMARIPDRTDPRKCNLFKHCWKLARETRGLLKQEEYKLYIAANLQILRCHNARIEPNGLCGDKAWIRWKVWKRLFDKKAAEIKGDFEAPAAITISPKIVIELDKTKRFLFEKCDGQPTQEKVQQFIDKNQMKMWISTGKVSIYYLVLSPWVRNVAKIEELEQKYLFDASLFTEKADDSVKAFFKKEYEHEFRSE